MEPTEEKRYRILIGIPVLNNLEITRACLQTLFKHTHVDRLNLGIDILIVDNGSRDDIEGMIRRDFADCRFSVHYLRNTSNRGVAGAWNQVLRFSTGSGASDDFSYDYYVISNNDVFFGQDWLQPMVEAMVQDGKIGWISTLENGSPLLPELVEAHALSKKCRIDPRTPYTTSTILGALEKIYEKWGGHESFCRSVKNRYLPDFIPYRKEGRSAVCFMVRPEMVKQIGFFDESYAPVGISEDLEYFLRIERIVMPPWLTEDRYPETEKWKCGFCGQSVVHHHWCSTHQGPDFDGRKWDKDREKNWQAKFGRSKKHFTGLLP
jgi:GT2 family glycosyltransferase